MFNISWYTYYSVTLLSIVLFICCYYDSDYMYKKKTITEINNETVRKTFFFCVM